LNIHRVNDIRHIEIHAAQSLIFQLSPFEPETATEKLKHCKSPGIDQIPAEIVQAGY
jgi:hypothetical protein